MTNVDRINHYLDRAQKNGEGIHFIPFENDGSDRDEVLKVITDRGWAVGKELRGELMIHSTDLKTLNYLWRLKNRNNENA